MGEDQLSAVRETIASLVACARSYAKDPVGHPRRSETFEGLASRATTYGERWGELRLEVEPPDRLMVLGSVVHEDGTDLPLAAALMGSGVRSLTLGQGIAREELETLADIVSRAGRGDEDVVCGLWRHSLWAVTVEAEDTVDEHDSTALADATELQERLTSLRTRARTPGTSGDPRVAVAPVGRDWAIEAPPPPPVTFEESRSQIAVDDHPQRALEVTRTGLWRADAPIPPENAAKLLYEAIVRQLRAGDLETAAALLDRADPAEAPAAAVKAAEKVVSQLGRELVRAVPPLYAQRAPQGEDAALALSLRCLGHLDAAGVKSAALEYPTTPTAARRPLRRLLSARGAEALEAIVRIADHKSLEIAKDGLGILALIPLEGARAALRRFVEDPTTPRDRLDLARSALAHANSIAPKATKTSVATTLAGNLRDPSREKRLAAARSLARLGPDPTTYAAVETLVQLPGFPSADPEEQKALIDALCAAGPDAALRSLELLAARTVGLPTNRMARASIDYLKKSRGGART